MVLVAIDFFECLTKVMILESRVGLLTSVKKPISWGNIDLYILSFLVGLHCHCLRFETKQALEASLLGLS